MTLDLVGDVLLFDSMPVARLAPGKMSASERQNFEDFINGVRDTGDSSNIYTAEEVDNLETQLDDLFTSENAGLVSKEELMRALKEWREFR